MHFCLAGLHGGANRRRFQPERAKRFAATETGASYGRSKPNVPEFGGDTISKKRFNRLFFQVRDCLKSLPDSLKQELKTKLEKALETHVHKENVQQLLSDL